MDEMAPHLRGIKANDTLVADQMDTFYRKKYLEIDQKM
jgi:hypothetical protein